MKKILCLLLSVICIVGLLVGCGKTEHRSKNTKKPLAEATEVKCIACGEIIKSDENRCPHCNKYQFVPEEEWVTFDGVKYKVLYSEEYIYNHYVKTPKDCIYEEYDLRNYASYNYGDYMSVSSPYAFSLGEKYYKLNIVNNNDFDYTKYFSIEVYDENGYATEKRGYYGYGRAYRAYMKPKKTSGNNAIGLTNVDITISWYAGTGEQFEDTNGDGIEEQIHTIYKGEVRIIPKKVICYE